MGSMKVGRVVMRLFAVLSVALCTLFCLTSTASAEPDYEFQTIDGSVFCYDHETGEYLSDGIYEVDGEKYYFRGEGSAWGPAGSMGKGWVCNYGEPAADYFFDRTTGRMYRNGVFTIDGMPYRFGDDGAVMVGWQEIDGFIYYVDPSTGQFLSNGIYRIDGSSYYFRGPGNAWGPEGSRGSGWVKDGAGRDFFFDRADGHMYAGGIYEIGGESYYFRGEGNPWGPEGSMGKGWVRGQNGSDYFFDRTTGRMYRADAYTIDGAVYRFGDDGAVLVGWQEFDGYTYYIDPTTDRPLAGGIFEVDGESYYFRPAGSSWGPEGSMGSGWVHGYKGYDSFFDRETGRMLVDGIYEIEGEFYFFRGEGNPWGPAGSMGKGWVRNYGEPAADYFFDRTTGRMYRNGVYTIDRGRFRFAENGAVMVKWQQADGYTFYIDPSTGEYLVGGIYEIDGESYYFRPAGSSWGPEGSMGSGWVRGYNGHDYFFDRDTGRMCKDGVVEIDGKPFRFDRDGALLSAWCSIDGFTFYVDPETAEFLADGIFEVEGEKYYFRGEGNSWGPVGSRGAGWVVDADGNRFFFDRTTGRMYRNGIFNVDGSWYYFRGAGNSWGPEGSMGKGWVRNYGTPAADYFFDRDTGKMYRNGIYTVDGVQRYFDADGKLSTAPIAWSYVGNGWINANGEVIPGAIAKGIDVSEWNGTIDWEKVKADGITFAILRIGYGLHSGAGFGVDAEFQRNASECERLGIPYGVYVYSYATNSSQAAKEADGVINALKGHAPSYPVYADIEDVNTQGNLSPATFATIATTFCTRIEAAGYQPGVYSMLSWWEASFTSPVFNQWSKWIAQIYSECQYSGSYRLWQCSWTGSVAGISGDVDLDFEFYEQIGGSSTPTTGRVLDDGVYEIAVASSPTLVLAVEGASTADRANISLATDANASNQRFRFTWDASQNGYKIENVNSGCVIDLAGSEAVIGANIQQYHAVGWLDQRWVITSTSGGYKIASAVNPSYYLCLGTSTPRTGANVQLGNSSSATTFQIRAV